MGGIRIEISRWRLVLPKNVRDRAQRHSSCEELPNGSLSHHIGEHIARGFVGHARVGHRDPGRLQTGLGIVEEPEDRFATRCDIGQSRGARGNPVADTVRAGLCANVKGPISPAVPGSRCDEPLPPRVTSSLGKRERTLRHRQPEIVKAHAHRQQHCGCHPLLPSFFGPSDQVTR